MYTEPMIIEIALLEYKDLPGILLLGVLIDNFLEPDLMQRPLGVPHKQYKLILLTISQLKAGHIQGMLNPLTREFRNHLVADVPGVLKELSVFLLSE